MRLTCPNCAAEYEVQPGLIPVDGRHVQCTACHTRWFVKPEAEATPAQIIARLETRRPRPLTVVPTLPAAAPPEEPADAEFRWEQADTPADAAPRGVSAPATPAPEPGAGSATTPAPQTRDMPPPAEVAPLAPSGRPRLDLTGPAEDSRDLPRPPSRFGNGVLAAAILVALAGAVYAFRSQIEAQVPAAAPTLESYGAFVDSLRERIASYLPAQ